MKLLELRLLAFGPFSGLTLDFSTPDPALHVIYGNNEAGKSTTLRAVRGLLYGIPQTSQDAHRYLGKELRVGGRIGTKDGRTLDFVRRKGRKGTLQTADGSPLDETALAPFLDGVTESAFTTMFGLDHESMRAGAQAMLEGRGEVGESLFSASLGGRGVHRVLSELRQESEDLFKARGRAKVVNQTITELREAKRLVEMHSASGAGYRKQNEELEGWRRERDGLSARLEELMAERARLERVRRVLPDLARRAEILAELDALADFVVLPADAAERRARAQRALEEADREAARLEEECASVQGRLDKLDIPQSLVTIDEVVVKHVRDALGGHHKAQIDLPKRQGELRVIMQEIDRGLRELHLDVGEADLERLRPSVASIAAVRALAAQHAKISADADHAERALTSAESRRDHYRNRLDTIPGPSNADALEHALSLARRMGDVEERLRRQRAERSALLKNIEHRVTALAPWTGPLASVQSLRIPSAETIDGFETRSEELVREEREARAERDRLERRARELRRLLDELTGQGAVPTESDLTARRQSRDEVWSSLRERMTRHEAILPARLDAYETSVREADAFGDRLRREADRAARHASLAAEQNAIGEAMAAAGAAIERVHREMGAHAEQWARLWQPLGVSPAPASEMRAWSARHAEVAELASELDAMECAENEVGDRLKQVVTALSAAVGEPFPADDFEDAYPRLVALAERALADRNAVESDRRALMQALDELTAEIAVRTRDVRASTAALQAWQADFEGAVHATGLTGTLLPEQALAMLDVLKELLAKVDKATDLRQRIFGMERDSQKLCETVQALSKRHLPELLALSWDEAAEALVVRYDGARHAMEHRASLQEEIERKRQSYENAVHRRNDARREIEQLMRAARVEILEDLERAERRSERIRQLAQQRDDIERRLRDAGEGTSLEELILQTRGIDLDTARARLAGIEQEVREVQEQREALRDSIVRAELGLLHFEGTEAANAALDMQLVASRLRSQVQRYVRLRLATALLERQIAEYRTRHQGPILERASELFPRLTASNYARLYVGFDADDEASLLCVRADGTEVGVEGLSEGARDQLYLALRLSTLERHAEHGDPMPLVLDDILIQFDDQRARAALEILGELAATRQVLFFTHHERLRDLARKAIPASRLAEHCLHAP